MPNFPTTVLIDCFSILSFSSDPRPNYPVFNTKHQDSGFLYPWSVNLCDQTESFNFNPTHPYN